MPATSDLIIVPCSALDQDPDLFEGILTDLRASGLDRVIRLLDPAHPSIPREMRLRLLHERYHEQFVADALDTGYFVVDGQGQLRVFVRQDLPVLAGYVFEVFTVRKVNENKATIGRAALVWCSERSRTRQDFVQQFHAYGTGHLSTHALDPSLFSPTTRHFDISFWRFNPNKPNVREVLTLPGTTAPVGIQVKAITRNEEERIIRPVLKGTYKKVLTYLKDQRTGRSSYAACMDRSRELYRSGKITEDQYKTLQSAIRSPESLGIDRKEVDDYYEYLYAWYREIRQEEAKPLADINDPHIRAALDVAVKEDRREDFVLTTLSGT